MTFMTFLLDVMIIFILIMWFWLLITVMGDLFRRICSPPPLDKVSDLT